MESDPPSVWPADDEDNQLVREVYARYGLAMFEAQVLEHGIVNALMVMRFIPTARSYSNQEEWAVGFDKFMDGQFEMTFGNLLRALDATGALPAALIDSLKAGKQKRDVLAHSFFRDFADEFMTPSGRIKMLAYCDAVRDEFSQLDAELDAAVRPIRQRYGITDAWIDSKIAETLAAFEQGGRKEH